MKLRLLPVLTAALSACLGGAPLYANLNGASPAAPDDALECVRAQLKDLGFSQTSLDVNDRRVTAKWIDEKTRRPDVNFRRVLDRIEVKTDPAADGRTAVAVVAHTFTELSTNRGPTEVEEKASDHAVAAAQTIIQRCGQ